MKITDIVVKQANYKLPAPFHPTWGEGIEQTLVGMTYIEIQTDEGISGICAGASNNREIVEGIETFIKPQLIGKNPLMIEQLRPIITNAKLRMGWPYAVEAALWDLVGKVAGLPVNQLWGGFQSEIPVYASTGEKKSYEERIQYVKQCIEVGFTAVKLRMHGDHPEQELEEIEELINQFKGQVKFMVDANQADHLPGASDMGSSWDVYTALKVARKLEELGCLWLEEPLARFNYEGLKSLALKVDIPIAGGEKNIGLNEFKDLAQNTGYQILQGDSIFSEGMFQLRKSAAIAEAFNKQFIPHTWSNPFGLMANLQLAASLPNCPWFEIPFDPPAYTVEMMKDIFVDGIEIVDGKIIVPDKPGLGFEIIENVISFVE